MTIDRLKKVHQSHPFRPFVLRISDQAWIRVTHPDSLAYDPRGRTVIFVAPDGSTQYIDLLHVPRLEFGNGARRRDRECGRSRRPVRNQGRAGRRLARLLRRCRARRETR